MASVRELPMVLLLLISSAGMLQGEFLCGLISIPLLKIPTTSLQAHRVTHIQLLIKLVGGVIHFSLHTTFMMIIGGCVSNHAHFVRRLLSLVWDLLLLLSGMLMELGVRTRRVR